MSIEETDLHRSLMRRALEQAVRALELGELPIGCVIANGDDVLVADHNRCKQLSSSLSHAETNALNKLPERTHSLARRLSLYVTVEPCLMCMGLIRHLQIGQVYFGAYDLLAGASYQTGTRLPHYYTLHPPSIVGGVLAVDAIELVKQFVVHDQLWEGYLGYLSLRPE